MKITIDISKIWSFIKEIISFVFLNFAMYGGLYLAWGVWSNSTNDNKWLGTTQLWPIQIVPWILITIFTIDCLVLSIIISPKTK